jgi:hypothetical protein
MKEISCSLKGLTPTEMAEVCQLLAQRRQAQTNPLAVAQNSAIGEIDGPTSALAQRIYKGLTSAPWGPRYDQILQELLDAPEGEVVKIEDLEKKLGATIRELRASVSKVSGRMKNIATPEEIENLRTPFLLIADLKYDEKHFARYQLTAAGREAVRRYLGR